MTNPMETKMTESVESLMSIMKNDYLEWAKRGEGSYRHEMYEEFCESLDYSIGKKYIKIFRHEGDYHSSTVCFVVNTTNDKKFAFGDVLKAAGWAGPARNFARCNVFDTISMERNIRWTGPSY